MSSLSPWRKISTPQVYSLQLLPKSSAVGGSLSQHFINPRDGPPDRLAGRDANFLESSWKEHKRGSIHAKDSVGMQTVWSKFSGLRSISERFTALGDQFYSMPRQHRQQGTDIRDSFDWRWIIEAWLVPWRCAVSPTQLVFVFVLHVV